MSDREQFLQEVERLNSEKEIFKVIASKPRPNYTYRNVSCEVIADDKGNLRYQIVYKTVTQHFTKVITHEEFLDFFHQILDVEFYYCELFKHDSNAVLLQNERGTSTFIKKKGFNHLKVYKHNREKEYLIEEHEPFLQKLGISSSKGRVFEDANKKYKQINKFIEIIDSLIKPDTQEISIVDMGCGKAYLTFAVYHYLTNIKKIEVHLVGYDIRQELVDECSQIAQDLKFTGLSFQCADIGQLKIAEVDMLIALHACDIATDMAIYAGLMANAKYMVLAPCCHKQIRKQMLIKNGITRNGILTDRLAEILTDAMRALILEDRGYTAKVFEFISQEHTAKNTMITAVKSKKNKYALIELKDIKESYAINYHYLERLLEMKI